MARQKPRGDRKLTRGPSLLRQQGLGGHDRRRRRGRGRARREQERERERGPGRRAPCRVRDAPRPRSPRRGWSSGGRQRAAANCELRTEPVAARGGFAKNSNSRGGGWGAEVGGRRGGRAQSPGAAEAGRGRWEARQDPRRERGPRRCTPAGPGGAGRGWGHLGARPRPGKAAPGGRSTRGAARGGVAESRGPHPRFPRGEGRGAYDLGLLPRNAPTRSAR